MTATIAEDLASYIKENKIYNLKLTNIGSTIVINTLPIKGSLVTNMLYLALFIYCAPRVVSLPKEWIYLAFAGCFFVIWMDFQQINVVIIDTLAKTVTVKSNNLIKRIFTGKRCYQFSEIRTVITHSQQALHQPRRYTILLELKNSETVTLTDVRKDTYASDIAKKILHLIIS